MKMPLKQVTAQDFFDVRRLKYQAPHLKTIDLPHTYNLEKALDKWIRNNLKHRYFIARTVGVTQQNSIDTVMRVGFEDAKELSYFVLACPHLKYK
jgi:hypothetical protein